jgi:hypothetical protein
MRGVIIFLIVVGLAQWTVLEWWLVVDRIQVDISVGRLFQDLLGITPRVAWDPAERLLALLLNASPGTLCLSLAAYLTIRTTVLRLMRKTTVK